ISGELFPSCAVGLTPDEVTIAEILKTQDYATSCIGKWHLGDQPEFLPTHQGFDHYLGIPYSNDMGLASEGAKSSLGEPLPKSKGPPASDALLKEHGGDDTGLKANQQPPLPLLKDLEVVARVKINEQQGIVKTYTDAAVQFIANHQQAPFFLYLPHTAVHFPIWPGKDWAGRSPHGYYSDWVEEVDWSVGEVLNAVREHGLAERTLVLFTSDNGGTPRAVNTPFRGYKGSTWEGGMREPTIAWWPGQIAAGTSTDEVTGMIDILPTLARLAGAQPPADRKMDGQDIWPLLSGQPEAKGHDTFYYFRGLKLEAVRSGPWKLHFANARPVGKYQRHNAPPREPMLIDLRADVGEETNLAEQHPVIVSRLQKLAQGMQSDLGVDGQGPGCRPLGRSLHPQPWISYEGISRQVSNE
ncbi:MAG: sulfatase-like hydrolase/transferase, partial [Planctomycetaceae bacterium]